MNKNFNAMLAALAFVPCTAFAQGWQDNYQGVMLQGFCRARVFSILLLAQLA